MFNLTTVNFLLTRSLATVEPIVHV